MTETINKIVRTSRQMLNEIGCEPTPEELAEKLGMPLEKCASDHTLEEIAGGSRSPANASVGSRRGRCAS
jgi:DNA-directed RNA polymerase sigma subunit (sigma70/sigma32)